MGLVLAAGLAALAALTGSWLGLLAWVVLYPVSPLLGYDLAVHAGASSDGAVLRAGGYAAAVAAANAAMAASVAVCLGAGLDDRSPLCWMAFVLAPLVGAPARAVAVGFGRGIRGSGWALIGSAVLVTLLAWITVIVAAGFALSRIDS